MTFPGGITLFESTQEEVDYVEDNFREGERKERWLADAEGVRTLVGEYENCWTVRASNGDILGYFGTMTLPNESVMSRVRGVCYMSCENVERHKFAFVKATPSVFKWVISKCPPWTDTFRTWPCESYQRSIRWQQRILRLRKVGRVPVKDDALIILETTRKEVESL